MIPVECFIMLIVLGRCHNSTSGYTPSYDSPKMPSLSNTETRTFVSRTLSRQMVMNLDWHRCFHIHQAANLLSNLRVDSEL